MTRKIKINLKLSKEDFKKKLEIKDGKKGDKGDKGDTGESKMGLPGPQGENGSPDTPEEVRDKLEDLTKGNKLSIQAIEDLADILEELKKERKGAFGLLKGSVHAGKGRDIRFVDDETPHSVGASTTIYTIAKVPIKGSLKVYRNGSRQRITEDYTFSGKTITFLTAVGGTEILLVDYRY